MSESTEGKHKKLFYRMLFLLCFAVLFFVSGYYTRRAVYRSRAQNLDRSGAQMFNQIREEAFVQDKYKYINPLLTCELSELRIAPELSLLKDKISAVIDAHLKSGDVQKISIYFDTRDGRWLGINMNEKYFPASLLKIPTMIAFLKKAEIDTTLLQKKIVYKGDFDFNKQEYFKPSKVLEPQKFYTVDELLERMIVESDNNALALLYQNIDEKDLMEVYTDLGLSIPEKKNEYMTDFMSVKSYANFFRVLYNASYLSRNMSEKALEWLTQSNFSLGLRAGVPEGVIIAKKFGERDFSGTNNLNSPKELHDCGVVYVPSRPYLLCVMTKGTDYEKLAGVIKDVSSFIYKEMERIVKK
ncbi:MAG: serine hydrolase [Candidatus Magasanikbacteria bacterium]|nr:serine hydrolase [Candidatus Magasanikbacteria bacterium]